MSEVFASETYDDKGVCTSALRFLDDGTTVVEKGGKKVETRPQTDDEASRVAAWLAPPPVTSEEEIAALKAKAAAHDKLVEILQAKNVIDAKDVGDIGAALDAAVAAVDAPVDVKP